VVQETQLEAFRRLDDFLQREPMPFNVWIRRTAYERLVDLRRQHVEAKRRATGREVALPDRSSLLLARQLVGPASTPSRQLERRELTRRVRQVVGLLPPPPGLGQGTVATGLSARRPGCRRRSWRALCH
jgi:RNA polymerase sigma-70 factor (ECF subfamily)